MVKNYRVITDFYIEGFTEFTGHQKKAAGNRSVNPSHNSEVIEKVGVLSILLF